MTFIDSTYQKFQELISQKDLINQSSLKNFSDSAVKIHGELKSRMYQYLSPKSVELCSKLIHAIPMTLILNILSTPQLLVVSAIAGACIWSCKKEFLPKDSKISLLHSLALVFFANIISQSTELSFGLLFKLPINAALLAGSLFMADQIEKKEEKGKPENKNLDPIEIELPDFSEFRKDIEGTLINQLAS